MLELEAGRSLFFPGPGTPGGSRRRRGQLGREDRGARRRGHRTARALRRALPVQEEQGEAGPGEADADRAPAEGARRRAGELELLNRRSSSLGFDFLKPARSGRTVVEATALEVGAGDKELLTRATFALERGEHVGLVGPNGSGKTTLLETILGAREPRDGKVRLGHGVVPAYFSQHEVELDERGSVLDCAQRATGLPRPQAQYLLGRFLFSGWEQHEKPVTALSGGERRRLALALVVASGANFLVLDEPTNHLDLESREALEAALDAFPGTVLLVSHDRALLDAVAERLLAIEDMAISSYDGGWAEYAQRRAEPAEAPAEPARTAQGRPKPQRPRAQRPSELERLEGEIARREAAVAELERHLSEDWSDVDTWRPTAARATSCRG